MYIVFFFYCIKDFYFLFYHIQWIQYQINSVQSADYLLFSLSLHILIVVLFVMASYARAKSMFPLKMKHMYVWGVSNCLKTNNNGTITKRKLEKCVPVLIKVILSWRLQSKITTRWRWKWEFKNKQILHKKATLVTKFTYKQHLQVVRLIIGLQELQLIVFHRHLYFQKEQNPRLK